LAQKAFAVDPKGRASLRALLQSEAASGLHARAAPRLHGQSGACALLWMRRNLEFHAALFTHLARAQADAADAAASAAAAAAAAGAGGAGVAAAAAAAAAAAGGGGSDRGPSRAALAAYGETTSRYHGWPLQQVYELSRLPRRKAALRCRVPVKLLCVWTAARLLPFSRVLSPRSPI